jgi:hypothetical protein
MIARFGWMCLAALAMLGTVATSTEAQIVGIEETQYQPGPPPTAQPKGTFTVPGTGKTYRVYVDYGYQDKGMFTPDETVTKGGVSSGTITTKVGGGDNGNWSSKDAHTLTNPKVGLYARARLQESTDGVNFTDVAGGTPVAYKLVGIPPTKDCEDEEEEPLAPSLGEYALSQFASRGVVAGGKDRT